MYSNMERWAGREDPHPTVFLLQLKDHQPAKFFCIPRLPLLNNMDEVIGEDEGTTLPLNFKL